MDAVKENKKSGQQNQNPPLPTLLYIDFYNSLSSSEQEQLAQVFNFLKSFGSSSVLNNIFLPTSKKFPCLVERKNGTTYLTIWNKCPPSYHPDNYIIEAESYTSFINAILLWLNKEHPNWLKLLSKEKFASNLHLPIESILNEKDNENQLQDQSGTGRRDHQRGSIIYGGRTEVAIASKPLSYKAILG